MSEPWVSFFHTYVSIEDFSTYNLYLQYSINHLELRVKENCWMWWRWVPIKIFKHLIYIIIVRDVVQGDPNQNLLIQMAITLKICISYPMLVKPKCLWDAKVFLKFVNKQLKNQINSKHTKGFKAPKLNLIKWTCVWGKGLVIVPAQTPIRISNVTKATLIN